MAKLYLGNTEIAPIVEVPAPEKKYGVDINAVLGDVDSSGALQFPTRGGQLDLSMVKSVPGYGLVYKFYKNTYLTGNVPIGITGALPGAYAMQYCFSGCTGLTSVDLSSLTTVSGSNGMASCFSGCTGLTSVDLSSLTTVSGGSGMSYCFSGCTGLTSVDLSSLTTVSGSTGMSYCFSGCTGLTSVSFPSLKEILPTTAQGQFSGMFTRCTPLTEIHFPSNMQARVEQLTGYASQFGAENAVIYFDLPSTADA